MAAVGDGALDVPLASGLIIIMACIWSGIITYSSISTFGIESEDNRYFSTISPMEVRCVYGTSRAPSPTGFGVALTVLTYGFGAVMVDKIGHLSFVQIVTKYAPVEL